MNNAFFIISIILFCVCSLELIVLLKDAGRVARLLSASKRWITEKGFFAFACRAKEFLAKKIKKYMRRFKKRNEAENVTLAILPAGGYGDFLLVANWLWHLNEKFIDSNVLVDVIYEPHHKGIAFSIFKNFTRLRLVCADEYSAESYSAAIFISAFPILKLGNALMMAKSAPHLSYYIQKLSDYNEKIRLECELHPRLDSLITARNIMLGKCRLQEPDFDNLLGISEEYKYEIPVDENEDEFLNTLSLNRKSFILVHRGWDASGPNVDFNVKGWSLNSCGNILPELKRSFPKYKIILFGKDRNQAPPADGADIDLIGKTSMEQVKVLLKNAACLVDNEGGMVHLRHALHGGPSVVLFGATSPALFGYSENINICSEACNHWCEWVSSDWASKCIRTGGREAPCMEAIKTADVVEAVKDVIVKNM